MTHEIIVAGFGGQGILLLGKILSYAAILDGKETTWISSYGVEMRGGTANCSVVISDQLIGSPFVSAPTSAIVLNTPAFEKFEPLVARAGVLIVNSSLVERPSFRSDIHVCRIPCSDIALELGNPKSVNLVALGALLALTGAVSRGAVSDSLEHLFANKSVSISSLEQAVSRGHASAQKETTVIQPMLNCA
jgi:2-oxoglutarate ferredoxin oxidoreductase subunit gamma